MVIITIRIKLSSAARFETGLADRVVHGRDVD